MLSDNIPHVKSPKRRPKSDKALWYSDSQKLEAVKCWLMTGNLSATAAALDIPLVTIKHWRYSQWWSKLVEDIKTENSIQLSAKLKRIADRALDVSMDRLENGDWVYNQKTGEMVRKPVALRDAHRVAVDLVDKSDKIERKPVEENTKTQDLLANLAKKFEEFSKKRVQVTDVVYVKGENNAESVSSGPEPVHLGQLPQPATEKSDGSA